LATSLGEMPLANTCFADSILLRVINPFAVDTL
jgi:hypothetical protein